MLLDEKLSSNGIDLVEDLDILLHTTMGMVGTRILADILAMRTAKGMMMTRDKQTKAL
jgi:hypothetical protein